MTGQILLVEDDDALRVSLAQTLDLEGIDVIATAHFVQARRALRANFAGIVLTDIRMPEHDGFDVLALAQRIDPELPVVMLTGEGDVPMAIRAMKEGAYDFLEKPCDTSHLLGVLNRALKHRALVLRNRRMEQRLRRSDAASTNFPGESSASRILRDNLRSAAENGSHVFLKGEKGVGKKVAAHTIFAMSEGRDFFNVVRGPEIDPDGFSIPSGKVDVSLKRFERTTEAQRTAILGVLKIAVDARFLISSSQEIPQDFAALGFVQLEVPNLKERCEDLNVMFEALLRQAARSREIEMPEIPDSLLEDIKQRPWHGNISELRAFANAYVEKPLGEQGSGQTLAERMDGFERATLEACLKANNGRAAVVAEELGVPRKTLYDRLARYGLRPRDYQTPDEKP